jgi:hypothetical protein
MRIFETRGAATLCFLLSSVLLHSCAAGQGRIVDASPSSDWAPILTSQQIAQVQESFSQFQPELFKPFTDVTNPDSFTPEDFSPALFFGKPIPSTVVQTPKGISVQTNGFHNNHGIKLLPATGTYFDRNGTPYTFELGIISRSPQNILERYMGRPLTPNAPTVEIDLRMGSVDLAYLEQLMYELRDQLSSALPDIAKVDPANCSIVIEPSIFYATNTNYGDSYAGGLTESLGGNRYRLHVLAFYMSASSAPANWADYLVDEGLNCYVLSVGRRDLAH